MGPYQAWMWVICYVGPSELAIGCGCGRVYSVAVIYCACELVAAIDGRVWEEEIYYGSA